MIQRLDYKSEVLVAFFGARRGVHGFAEGVDACGMQDHYCVRQVWHFRAFRGSKGVGTRLDPWIALCMRVGHCLKASKTYTAVRLLKLLPVLNAYLIPP